MNSMDSTYFEKKLTKVLGGLERYTPQELARALGSLAATACEDALLEDNRRVRDLKPLLSSLQDSITGDNYMGYDWETKTMGVVLQKLYGIEPSIYEDM